MKFIPTIKSAIFGLKVILSAFACWPLPADAKPSHVRWYNRWWWFLFIHLTVTTSMSFNSLYLNLDNPHFAIRLATELAFLLLDMSKMVISKVEASRLQRLLAEMEEFLQQATEKEMQIIQRYADRCAIYYVVILVFCIFGDSALIIVSAISPQPLPINSTYPFSIEPFWIWAILYFSHCVIILQSDAITIQTLEYTFLLWLTAARFEVMCAEFQNAINADDLKRCIRKHQELIEYADRLTKTTRVMAIGVMGLAVCGVTTGGFVVIDKNSDWWERMEYVIYNLGCGTVFHLFVWPADNLRDMSEEVLRSVYNSAWIDKPEMLKDTLIIGQRSLSPIIIAIRGLFPALSLELFASAVSATFSYLAMLRAVAGD